MKNCEVYRSQGSPHGLNANRQNRKAKKNDSEDFWVDHLTHFTGQAECGKHVQQIVCVCKLSINRRLEPKLLEICQLFFFSTAEVDLLFWLISSVLHLPFCLDLTPTSSVSVGMIDNRTSGVVIRGQNVWCIILSTKTPVISLLTSVIVLHIKIVCRFPAFTLSSQWWPDNELK